MKIVTQTYVPAIRLGVKEAVRLISEAGFEGADLSLGIMTLINLAVLIIMSREIKEETELYFGKRKK